MAADILIYKATHVPVGEDQKQHLELCRDIAKKFNFDFKKDIFPIIEPIIIKKAARIMSLRDASNKMSKSDPSNYSRIMLNDSSEEIDSKIKKAKTDSMPFPENIENAKSRPEALNLITIYAAMNNIEIEKVIEEYANTEFSSFKKKLSESIISTLSPIGNEINKLLDNQDYLDSIILKGADKARSIANPVINEVYEKMGLLKT